MTETEDAEATGGPRASRRSFLEAFAVMASTPILGSAAAAAAAVADVAQTSDSRQAVRVDLEINGHHRSLLLDPRTTLLDALREHAGLTGTKKGCDHGQCGACTVQVGRRHQLACLTLAVGVREPVLTIEGIAGADGSLHPMQKAFIDRDAFQCGYCTPGQIISAIACVAAGSATSDADIREFMSGNLCRCAAYPNIVAAIRQARDEGA